ncbi:MAG TPA: MGMT family protein [Patescibacteria group bacterium]|nr:MGMT family protein [Patescibacteria group bacterium]
MKRRERKSRERSFASRVFAVVKRIPRGSVKTYQKVAQEAGNSRAARAVGSILHKNNDPAIPCHRVIRSNGELGGYNRGKKRKRQILAQEGYRIDEIR